MHEGATSAAHAGARASASGGVRGGVFFSSWESLGRVALTGVLAYAALVALLRVSGKRTLSKMNAFDLVVTVALGSCLATVILSKDVPLADGLAGVGLLIALQYAVAWLSVRSSTLSDVVKSEPALLVRGGELLRGAMRRERVLEAEILAAVREQGLASLAQVDAVVLETDGSLSVIQRSDADDRSALSGVTRPAERREARAG